MRWYRDDRRVFQGRLPWRYELAPRYHGGAAWNIHPLASFPRFSPLPSSFSPPLLSFFRAFSLFLYVSLSFATAALRIFLPRIHTYSLGRPPYALPCVPPFFSILASFVPRLTLQWKQRWWFLSPFLSSSSTSNRASSTPRFYFVTASLIPTLSALRYTSLLSRGIVAR